jgi:tetratricopeptide (TPR) repeat protein
MQDAAFDRSEAVPAELSPDAIRTQLERILASRPFAGSDRLKRFLRFVVERTLAGDAAGLKEYAIGTQVYDRGESFDPRADGIVRTEASRLRARLETYYSELGQHDEIRIDLPKGGYVPAFCRVTASSHPSAHVPSRSVHRLWAWASGSAIVAIGAIAWLYFGAGVSRPDLPRRDWLLIATFDNRTNEPLLTGTLELSLEMELSRSSFVNVVPRARVEDTLRLMKTPVDSPLPPAVAREVAIRDGGIPAVVAGTITKVGSTYELGLNLMSADGAALAAHGARASTPDALLAEIREAARWLRRSLGERSSDLPSGASLEPVTTPSLQALRFFSQGMVEINRRQWAPAEAMLKLAVAEDPEFASAYVYLMHAVRNQAKPDSEWRGYLVRARELAPQVSERERLFILGSTHGLDGDVDGAVAFYEALLRTYPNDHWALNNLAGLLRQRDPARALVLLAHKADLRPNDLNDNLNVAGLIGRQDGHFGNAERFVSRARRIASGTDEMYRVDTLLAFEPWMRGDMAAVRETFKRLAGAPHLRDQAFLVSVALPAMGLGMLKFAEAHLVADVRPAVVGRWRPWIAAARGDQKAFRRYALVAAGTPASPLSVIVLTRAGYLKEAHQMLSASATAPGLVGLDSRSIDGIWQVVRGEIALASGQSDDALALFKEGSRLLVGSDVTNPLTRPPLSEIFLASESGARILMSRDQLEEARDFLKVAVAERATAYSELLYLWVRCAKRLEGLERGLGNTKAADELDRQLRALLADADPDFRLDSDWAPDAPAAPAAGRKASRGASNR